MTEKAPMKIGILLCGHAPDELLEKYGNYDEHFVRLLGVEHFEYVTWKVIDNELPDDIQAVDGWLITGSKHGVYEDHPWIAPLEQFLREVYQASIPIIGICFGHQILAQALGGNVRKFDGGWSVGRIEYRLDDTSDSLAIIAWHQDQIIDLPMDAKSFGSTPFCQYAFVSYGDKAMTMQPHPEFTDDFALDLLATRGKSLPEDQQEICRSSIGFPLATKIIVEKMTDFFYQNRKTTGATRHE